MFQSCYRKVAGLKRRTQLGQVERPNAARLRTQAQQIPPCLRFAKEQPSLILNLDLAEERKACRGCRGPTPASPVPEPRGNASSPAAQRCPAGSGCQGLGLAALPGSRCPRPGFPQPKKACLARPKPGRDVRRPSGTLTSDLLL